MYKPIGCLIQRIKQSLSPDLNSFFILLQSQTDFLFVFVEWLPLVQVLQGKRITLYEKSQQKLPDVQLILMRSCTHPWNNHRGRQMWGFYWSGLSHMPARYLWMKLVSWKPHVLRVGNFAKMVNDNQKHLVISYMIELE